MLRTRFALALLPLALAGCGKSKTAVVAAPPPAPVAVVERPMPRPPMGAAANLTLPIAGPDGAFATPNRNLSAIAAQWHLRAALNVAVLQCVRAGDPMEAQYNGFIATHKKAMTRAHDGLKAEYRTRFGAEWQDRFDDDMTRLYNYYAQPPARAAFCAAAQPLIAAAAATPAGSLDDFAATALQSLDVPFTDFYRAYADYRADLAAWQTDRTQPAPNQIAPVQIAAVQPVPLTRAPVLTVARDLLMADTGVTGGD
jgi:hypothetical protein